MTDFDNAVWPGLGDDEVDFDKAIAKLRLILDNLPNAVDYPASNLLTIVDNLANGAVPSELREEIRRVSKDWLAQLFRPQE